MPDDDEFYIEAEETPDFFEEETRISKNPDVIEVNTIAMRSIRKKHFQ